MLAGSVLRTALRSLFHREDDPLAVARRQILELQAKVRELTIELITDLEISAGMTQFKDRCVRIETMRDETKFPLESLEAMQRIFETMLSHLGEQEYIQ